MQNSLKLIDQALSGLRPLRTPIFDLLTNDAIIEHFAGKALDGTGDETAVKTAAGNALDGTRSIATPNRQKSTWIDPAGNTRVSDRWTDWLQKPAFSDVAGWAQWLRKYLDEAGSGEERTIHLDLTESQVCEEKIISVSKKQREYSESLDGTANIFCTPSTAIFAFLYYIGLEMFSYLWADFQDLVKHWIQVYQQETLHYIETAAHVDTSPMAMIYSDIAYKNGPMFSRKMLEEMDFFYEVERITAACHGRGLKVIFHSDGNIMELLDDLVATGIDGLNPIEKAAGMDIFEIRRKYPELTLVGGVDVTNLLRVGSPVEIRQETRKIIEQVGSEGRLLIGSSTEVGNDIPLENYLAFHDEVMKG